MTIPANSTTSSEAQFALVFEEIIEAVGADEGLDVELYIQRFPEHAERLRRLLPAVGMLADLGQCAARRESAGLLPPGASAPVLGLLGDFRIVREIGRGGMGVVYEAEQISLGRRVALKVLPFAATMDPRHLHRFQNEARAAASLEHPHIVPVYGVGCERGVHYYAMKFIDGQSLADLIDQQHEPLESGLQPAETRTPTPTTAPAATARTERTPRDAASFRQIAEWGIHAAEALEHAHSVGIVHRDIKPANVLIDGQGALWVTDFGLARMGGDAGLTLTGDMIGTLRYMSPEQALAKHGLVDHRTDVYSLGVTLYELLTGTPAIQGDDREEILTAIMWEEPRPPRALDSTIPPDLETIVLKGMAKDPADRYATAKELADDLRCLLEDRPILARRPSLRQRATRLVRRHQGVSATATIAVVVMLLLLVAGLWANNHLIRQEQIRTQSALEAEAEQRALAQANEATAEAQKKQAIQFRDLALNALRAATGEDVEKLLGAKQELGANERAYLEAIAERWNTFGAQAGKDNEARFYSAQGHFRVAYLWQKLGRLNEARAKYETARDIQRQLVEQFPAAPGYQRDLGETYYNLGILLRDLGRREEALVEADRGLVIRQQLAKQYPANLGFQRELANSYNSRGAILVELGKADEARQELARSRDVFQLLVKQQPTLPSDTMHLAIAHNNLATLLSNRHKGDEAFLEFTKARDIMIKLSEQFPAVPGYRQFLADVHYNLGNALRDMRKPEEACRPYESARDLRKQLADQFPAVPEHRRKLARTHDDLAALYRIRGQNKQARFELEQAREILQKLTQQFPQMTSYQVELGAMYCNLGSIIRDEGKPADSLAWYAKAIATLTPAQENKPRDGRAQGFLRNSFSNRAIALVELRKYAEAVKDWGQAIELSPKSDQFRFRVARARSRLQAGQVAEAIGEAEALAPPRAGTIEFKPGHAGQWYSLACFYATASKEVADKKQTYADRAMELLLWSIQAGFHDAALMGKDTDLDPLRERDDFKKLLAKLQHSRMKTK